MCEKKIFAHIDSLKQSSVALRKEMLLLSLHAKRVWKNVMFKSDVDFNCIFSAMVKRLRLSYVAMRTQDLVNTISTVPRNSKCPTTGALQDDC